MLGDEHVFLPQRVEGPLKKRRFSDLPRRENDGVLGLTQGFQQVVVGVSLDVASERRIERRHGVVELGVESVSH